MKGAINIRTRLALQYAALLAAILALCSAIALFSFLHGMRESFDTIVDQAFDRAREHFQRKVANEDLAKQGAPVPTLEGRGYERNTFVEVRTPSGDIVFRNDALSNLKLPDPANVGATSPERFDTLKVGGKRLRVMTGSIPAHGKKYFMRIALDEDPVWKEFNELLETLLWVFPIALGLAGLGGYWMATRALRPVGAIIEATKHITASRLAERLPVNNSKDELGRLAIVLNGLLDRLERSFDQLRRFSADASHELRTPLQAIRSLGEVALHNQADADYYRDVLSNILEETDRMTKLTQNLLTLSRADAGQIALARQPTALGAMTKEVVTLLEVLAEEKGQTIQLELRSNPTVLVDPLVFRQALINIVDNAIKYSPPSSKVRIEVLEQEKRAQISVIDAGPGIAAEHQMKIFDRFYRIDKSRSRELGGAGLGLSITKWAVETHGGTLTLQSEVGRGTKFDIHLPVA